MRTQSRRTPRALFAVAAVGTLITPLLADCSGAGGAGGAGGGSAHAINVLMVNNPQMVELQKLTADNFTKKTGIK